MNRKGPSFRIGRVRGDRRGRIWYLTYYEQGRRHRRHLPPYTENPFTALDLNRLPIENSKPIVIFTPETTGSFRCS